MGLFKCEKCGCVENTALGFYWQRKFVDMYIWDESNKDFKGKPLCSECGPKYYAGGSLTTFGEWHGVFPKRYVKDISEKEYKNLKNS